ncbi:Bombesin receptor subtype-3 [Holothuria leucospilota]|uniref:Bombesin receptor subtype-3 n=1 Tax=Holothuria leucospilota TaxID=206669 RepID=A0A9Q1BGZ5_HOLLE|nr:Bombesin receptor subtype-3 [Holothuria leucospilota]
MESVTYSPGENDPNEAGWSSDQDSFDDAIWIRASYGVIAGLGILGNALVIFTIARVKALQNLTNFFIACLAATDFITSIFLIPLNMGNYIYQHLSRVVERCR